MAAFLVELNEDLAAAAVLARAGLVSIRSGRQSVGAGAVWHPEGLILTNAHVLQQRHPQVVVQDGRSLPARILAVDRGCDLAALEVQAAGLPAVVLGSSRGLRPGAWVMAVGHPWGVEGAATAGVVIGSGASLPGLPTDGQSLVAVALHLRPGHSGGVLVDELGRVVGINTMAAGPDVGLAVPVDVAKRFVKAALGGREGGPSRLPATPGFQRAPKGGRVGQG